MKNFSNMDISMRVFHLVVSQVWSEFQPIQADLCVRLTVTGEVLTRINGSLLSNPVLNQTTMVRQLLYRNIRSPI